MYYLSTQKQNHKRIIQINIYSDDFNAKVEVAVLQQRQDCEKSHTENLKLNIQENDTFIGHNQFSQRFVYLTDTL